MRHQRVPEFVTDTILLPSAIRSSSRKALLVLFGFYQLRTGHCQHRPPWYGLGHELALSSLWAGGS